MRLFYIVSKSPACFAVHNLALKKIKERLAAGDKVQGIFFINEGAQCASSLYEEGSVGGKTQSAYIFLSKKHDFPLLVCGRAFKTCGFNASVLKDGYLLSGNTELVMKLNDCDEVEEF